MRPSQAVRIIVLAAAAGCGLYLMSRLGALQLPSVLAYSGIVAFLGGLVSVLAPPRWLGFSRRYQGPLAGALAGAVLFAAGWFWPAGSFHTPSRATRLDAFMPEYNFHERHEMTIEAPPDRVRSALDRVSWAEIGIMETLGRIRNVAISGSAARGRLSPAPIVDSIKNPRAAFFLLDDTPREFVFGLAGQPWNNAAVRLNAAEFPTWAQPGSIKVAANFLIEDAGNNRSRVVTETRVLACDATARKKMARYWALICPGSGMLRRSLLEAVRVRAEKQ
jgi:hypothetical protein